ncbi:hypothetical protein [Ottowia testudinis]|uniref:Uncharacterized protein n=1 Tax=Ottowia testudinis TaxID=2816950 RepID=A0A975CDX2_9BURK|nr:hypothetical protein [Ottowia testudinis]QTD44455.1 hypothetical protein J1M35_15320 [Ottowia testudinis]
MAPTSEGVAKATVCVTIDNEREIAAVNAWFNRWGPRIRCGDNQGCGCCVDIWDVEAPPEALRDLPAAMVSVTTG